MWLLLFSHSIITDSLQPHELQHDKLSYPSPSPGVCSNSCPLNHWWHPVILSSVIPFSSCPQSFPALGSFPMIQLFAPSGQSIEASASVLLVDIQGWFPLGLTSLISLQSKGLKNLLQHYSSKSSVLHIRWPKYWSFSISPSNEYSGLISFRID